MFHRYFAKAAIGILALLGLWPIAQADDRTAPVPLLPKYQQECAACHTAYPPGLLPAASWQRLMGGLGKHFGVEDRKSVV